SLRADQEHAERLRGVAAKINRRSGIAIDAAFASVRDDSHDASRRPVLKAADNSEMTSDAGGSPQITIRECTVYHQLARGTIHRLTTNFAGGQRQLYRFKVTR